MNRAAPWRIAALLTGTLAIAGCPRRAPVEVGRQVVHYEVGPPWQGSAGAWFYPREQESYDATGLAVVETLRGGTVMADGERYDPDAVTASLQTLQLPSVIQVHDLENGRTLLVRAIGRGPDDAGRLVALSPAAARLLGIDAGMPARVAITLDAGLSQAIASSLPGAPQVAIQAAPVGAVSEQALGPPGTASVPVAAAPSQGDADARRTGTPTVPARISARVVQGEIMPGQLWVDGGRFSVGSSASEVAAQMNGQVSEDGSRRETVYRVLAGPFRSVSEADAALDQARRAGVTGAHIIVE